MKKKLTTQGFKRLKQSPQPAASTANSPAGIPLFLRSQAETSLGGSLDNVRVHSDGEAAESAQALGARAYTTGRDIVFAPGQYNPHTPQGRQLLAHELAHVVQQSGGKTRPAVGSAGDAHEQSAHRAAGNVMAGTPASIAPVSGAPAIQREAEKQSALTSGSETVDAFPAGSATLNDAQKERIAHTAGAILVLRADHPSTSVTVAGHTDAVGGEAFNIGQVRADAVKQELIARGVPAESISATTVGSHRRKVRTTTAESRNRRVEIRFEAAPRPQKKAENLKPEPEPEPKPETPPPLRPLIDAIETGRKILAPTFPHPGTAPKSPAKPLLDSVDKAMDSVLERLGIPAPLRPLVRSGAKSAATKAVVAPLDAAMDEAHLKDTDKKAVLAALQAVVDIALP